MSYKDRLRYEAMCRVVNGFREIPCGRIECVQCGIPDEYLVGDSETVTRYIIRNGQVDKLAVGESFLEYLVNHYSNIKGYFYLIRLYDGDMLGVYRVRFEKVMERYNEMISEFEKEFREDLGLIKEEGL